jgi:hypothetical protein
VSDYPCSHALVACEPPCIEKDPVMLRLAQSGAMAGNAVQAFSFKTSESCFRLKRGRELSIATKDAVKERIRKLANQGESTGSSTNSWYYIALGMSGISTLCAGRMVTDKNRHQVSRLPPMWSTAFGH